MIKVDSKIVGWKVLKPEEAAPAPLPEPPPGLHLGIERPDMLSGYTYKIKPPLADSAIYITINDIVVGDKEYPFEIFINSKDSSHFQWVAALTRIISAIFRMGGSLDFLVEELEQIFDPQGGYYIPGTKGKYANSLIAHIGHVIKNHLSRNEELRKLEEICDHHAEEMQSGEYPPNAQLCQKCNTKALVVLDNCATCLNCGDSKCG